MATPIEDQKLLNEMACEAAEKFVKLYYDKFDKSRHLISKLYSDDAKLIWDGNPVEGHDNISKFHENIPGTYHVVETIDAQQIPGFVTCGQNTIMVCTSGSVKFQNKFKMFNQSFLLTSRNNDWKVMSDCFRLTN